MHATATHPKKSHVHATGAVAACVTSRQQLEVATAQALTQGGDARLELGSAGLNQYGFAPRPDLGLVAFGSSTASGISEAGFQAATALQARLQVQPSHYHPALARQRQELLMLTGADRVPGTELVLAASGTDLHLFAMHLAQETDAAVQAVMVEPSETGSGVPAALGSVHFAHCTSQGQAVEAGAGITATPGLAATAVRLRHDDGTLRDRAAVDADFTVSVQRIVQAGQHCLLVLTDVSKTGLLAPSAACACQLQQLYPNQLTVLVDACQFRMSPATLATYLAQDFMVTLTGSKFVGGPAFCGALLLPPGVAQRTAKHALHALQDYTSRLDWPPQWPGAACLPDKPNPGLLLRWEAALAELRQFRSIPDVHIQNFLQVWAQAVATRLATDPTFEALPVAPLQRANSDAPGAWDAVQTIFPFLLHRQTRIGQRRPLSTAETTLLYHQLREPQILATIQTQTSSRFQLGQPVRRGHRDGIAVSALRLCVGARWVTQAAQSSQGVAVAVMQAMQAFDKLAELIERLPP